MARGFSAPGIHILYGTGTNCTCYDCIDLYGGECATTKDNDFLDKLEKKVLAYLNKTPTGRDRKKSDSYADSVIENVVRPEVKKYLKIKNNIFYRQYYSFMPLVILMTSDYKEARLWYRRSRNWLFNEVSEKLKNEPETTLQE